MGKISYELIILLSFLWLHLCYFTEGRTSNQAAKINNEGKDFRQNSDGIISAFLGTRDITKKIKNLYSRGVPIFNKPKELGETLTEKG